MKILSVLFAFTVLLSIGCKNAPERPDAILDENYEPIVPSNTPPPATTAEPAQNAQGVWHYTCNNGCAGGGGSATACATCGSTLVHNSAYHAAAGGTPTAPTAMTPPVGGSQIGSITNPVVNGSNPTATAPPPIAATPPATPEPPQNAQGVWHYICNNGCAGGGGSAVACASCGSTLAHNSAYHN